ncbi:Sulfatase [Crateriforma conspicua]|nr:Sulfatase [Crateriforma conspicua]
MCRRYTRIVTRTMIAIAAASFILGTIHTARADDRPNILWITSEDNGPELGCYNDAYADTPRIDALASRSLRYKRCWSNAPVCAPARTTIVSGMYATSLGAHHMRSAVGLPDAMRLYPLVFRDAGYYTSNNNKTDYNFANPEPGWHDSSRQAHWRGRAENQPFFAVFNFTVSHESKIRNKPHTLVHDPAKAKLPAYHPDTPEVRRDWAQYYDRLTEMDAMVGKVLDDLKADGLDDSTIVFYYGDHGSGMPRSKRWPFDSGLHVPLLVHVPEKFRPVAPENYLPGGMSDRLVAFVDLAPTALSMAGIQPPENMQGVPFAGQFAGEAKPFIFGYRGRMDERIDEVRSCTDGRFVYMKHFYPDRPYLKHVEFMFQTPTTQVWKRMFDEGKLNDAQSKFWQPKPSEELFDLESDPDETVNVAGRPEHADRLRRMRQAMQDWSIETRDLGLLTEAEIHRRSGDQAPRTFGLSPDYEIEQLVQVAYACTDRENPPSLGKLNQWVRSSESGVRYWAVRSFLCRPDDAWKNDASIAKMLEAAMLDDSPSVRVAAAEVAMQMDGPLRQRAPAVLANLADVDNYGQLVPVAALNVLDKYWSELPDDLRERVEALPEKTKDAPQRVSGYVGRLLKHVQSLP